MARQAPVDTAAMPNSRTSSFAQIGTFKVQTSRGFASSGRAGWSSGRPN